MNGGWSHQCTCSWYLLNSPVDHIYNNVVHIYDNGLSISSNPVFLNFFPHIYKLCIFSFPEAASSSYGADTLFASQRCPHTRACTVFFIGIAVEYILGVHSTSISAVKTKMGRGTLRRVDLHTCHFDNSFLFSRNNEEIIHSLI